MPHHGGRMSNYGIKNREEELSSPSLHSIFQQRKKGVRRIRVLYLCTACLCCGSERSLSFFRARAPRARAQRMRAAAAARVRRATGVGSGAFVGGAPPPSAGATATKSSSRLLFAPPIPISLLNPPGCFAPFACCAAVAAAGFSSACTSTSTRPAGGLELFERRDRFSPGLSLIHI